MPLSHGWDLRHFKDGIMALNDFEEKLLEIIKIRLPTLRGLVSQGQRKDMNGKDQLIYDTLRLNEKLQKMILDKQAGITYHF